MEETASKLKSTARNVAPREDSDPQVAQIKNDPPLPALCDVVTKQLLANRHPERPLLSRLAVVAEIGGREDTPRALLEAANSIVTKRVNAEDPTGGVIRTQKADGPPTVGIVNITGACVELPNHIVAVFESEPPHLLELVRELRGKEAQSATGAPALRNVHVLYSVDDIMQRTSPYWTHVDASSVTTAGAESSVPLHEQIVKAVRNLEHLATTAAGLSKAQREHFSTTAVTSQAKALPTTTFAETCIKSGLCLTAAEFVDVFGRVPDVIRANEIVHPIEPPLQYK